MKTRKRRNKEIKGIFYTNLHLKDRLNIEFTASKGELMPEEALDTKNRVCAY